MRIVVVTASIGERRGGFLTPHNRAAGVRYVAFTDHRIRSSSWEVIRVDRGLDDSTRDAKRYKIDPTAFVEADATIWIDRHCRLMCDPVKLFESFDEDVALVSHYRRCLFHEARACIKQGKDDPEAIRKTVRRFRLEGFPAGAGLYYGGFIARRHSEAERRFSELWGLYVDGGSRRDQLSLPVALQRSGVSLHVIPRAERPGLFLIRGK